MQTCAYGSWPSPLTAAEVVAGHVSVRVPVSDGEDLYWIENRAAGPALVRRPAGGAAQDVMRGDEPHHRVRTRLHEYGGGDYSVRDGLVVYADAAEQRVWCVRPGEAPQPLTPPTDGAVRFGGFVVDAARGVVYAVREDQRDASVEPVTSLVRLALDGAGHDLGVELVAGRRRPVGRDEDEPADVTSPPDFVLDPAMSPDGSLLAWVSWNHPEMPWDGTWLWVATIGADGSLGTPQVLAGDRDEAVEQPTWLPDGRLAFVSDRTGRGQLYAVTVTADGDGEPRGADLVALTADDADYGLPRWGAGTTSFVVLGDGRLATGRTVDGVRGLAVVDPARPGEPVVELATPITYAFDLAAVPGGFAVRGASTDRPLALWEVQLAGGADGGPGGGAGDVEVTLVAPHGALGAGGSVYASEPEVLSWPTDDGSVAHGFFYPPSHPDVVGPPTERPPLLVTLHGGPTASAVPGFGVTRTFWTSRGFAVLDVNYGGSVGFGRDYRARLDGQWGVVDVTDATSGVRHLVERGVVDPARVAITGESAGGFSTLAALTTTTTFTAGASHFGISDLTTLVRDTHKLESRYPWRLVGQWPAESGRYADRSPINHVDALAAPILITQGAEDRVVPPSQALAMADVLRAKGLPVALVLFEGEGHGYRDVANRRLALEYELSFYGQVFGFEPSGDIASVEVENLPDRA